MSSRIYGVSEVMNVESPTPAVDSDGIPKNEETARIEIRDMRAIQGG